jgi:hypothetical protein
MWILFTLSVGSVDLAVLHFDPLVLEGLYSVASQRIMNSFGLTSALLASSQLVRFFISIHSRFDPTAKRTLHYIDIYLASTTTLMLGSTLGELVNGWLHAVLFSILGAICVVVLLIFSGAYAVRTLRMATVHPTHVTNAAVQQAQKQAALRLVRIMKGGMRYILYESTHINTCMIHHCAAVLFCDMI